MLWAIIIYFVIRNRLSPKCRPFAAAISLLLGTAVALCIGVAMGTYLNLIDLVITLAGAAWLMLSPSAAAAGAVSIYAVVSLALLISPARAAFNPIAVASSLISFGAILAFTIVGLVQFRKVVASQRVPPQSQAVLPPTETDQKAEPMERDAQ